MSTKSLKEEMKFIESMKKLIEALRDIDCSHFQTLHRSKAAKFEEFDNYFKGFFKVAHLAGSGHPMLTPRAGCIGIIVISSDAGFMGKLNTQVCKTAMDIAGDSEAEMIVLGKKGRARFRYSDKKVTFFPGIVENRRYQQANEIKNYVIKQFLDNKIGRLLLIYPKSISFAVQKITVQTLLPATDLFEEKERLVQEEWQSLCVESDFTKIVEYLVETWISTKLLDTFYESKLAEYASRTNQLESSIQYLSDESKRLASSYNKSRQSDINTGTREVFSAMLGTQV